MHRQFPAFCGWGRGRHVLAALTLGLAITGSSHAQSLTSAEYFWDTDPGNGAGTAVSGPTADAFILGQSGVATLDVNVSALTAGVHQLGFRVRDQSNRWSAVSWLPVDILDAATLIAGVQKWPGNEADKQLVAAEYFWEEDPGRGNGTAINWTASDSAVLGGGGIPPLDVDVTGLANGTHRLGYRARSASGTWSATTWIGVEVETGFSRLNPFPTATGGAAAVAWPDVDGDGRPDLFVTGIGPESANQLTRNNDGTGFIPFPGSFSALQPSLDGPAGIAWADLDNDGRIDAFLPSATESLSRPGRLVRNLTTGLEVLTSPTLNALSSRTFGGAWADFDLDGRVDLVLPNFAGTGGNRLLRNTPSGFVQTASASLASDLTGARQAAWADFDNDGDPDLLITADAAVGNALFRNDRSSGFIRLSQLSGFTGRGAAWADFDNDGRLDLVVGASGSPAARVFRNAGNDTFQEVPIPALSLASANESAPAWFDYNADGWLDLAVPSTQGLILLQNDRQGGFGSSTATAGLSLQSPDGATPIAAATADFDNDGFPDLFVAQSTIRPGWLYRNPGNSNHWLKVSLESDFSNGSAIGARVEVTATIGGTNLTQTRVVSGGDGGSQSALEALFGMGEAPTATRVFVQWPSGITRTLTDVPTDNSLTITELPVIPEITAQPQDQAIPAGTPAVFSVVATGRGTLGYQWFHDGTPVPGATNATLTVPNASIPQSGRYAVSVSNALGSITSTPAELLVNPVFAFSRIGSGAIASDVANTQEAQWVDFDGDGDLDLFLVCISAQNILYRNDGSEFVRLSIPGLTTQGDAWTSASWADYDLDGDLDVAISRSGGTLALFRQEDPQTFTQVSDPAVNTVSGLLTGVSFIDFDRDGYVDLCQVSENGTTALLRNIGGTGFAATSLLSGLVPGLTYGGTWGDPDGDGWPDLLLNTYLGAPSALLRNRGPNGFVSAAGGNLASDDGRSTTAAWADYDNDGDMDLAVGNFDAGDSITSPVFLYRNDGNNSFTRVPEAGFPTAARRVYGLSWGDYDNDGFVDLYVASNNQGSDLLYRNLGNGTFTFLNSVPEFSELVNSGGTSTAPNWVDYDQDGRLDLSVGNAAGNLFLFRNQSIGLGNWLQVRCLDAFGVESIGARVRVTATLGGTRTTQRRDLLGGGFRSTEPLLAHFGLRDAEQIESLVIDWPSSGVQTLTNVTINRLLTVEEAPDKPFISMRPQSLAPAAGTTVVLKARAVGASPLSLQWYRNGQPVPGATNSTLALTNAKPTLSGDYWLTASNPAGSCTSAVAVVKITWQTQLVRTSIAPLTTDLSSSAGVAFGDYDNDGFPDVAVANHGAGSVLFRNAGGTSFTSTLPLPRSAQTLVWGDYDNDGYLDLFVTVQDPAVSNHNILYHNLSGGGFEALPQSSLPSTEKPSVAGWADVDSDGWVDIVVSGGVRAHISFYRNNRDGTFTDVSGNGGTLLPDGDFVFGDYDGDARPDLLTNDGRVRLYRNLGGFAFVEVPIPALTTESNVSVARWADTDNDGDWDIALASSDHGMIFLRNDGVSGFVRNDWPGTAQIGTFATSGSWCDFNQDGWIDFLVTSAQANTNILFLNQQDGTLAPVALPPSTDGPGNCPGSAWADIDRNGTPDLLITDNGVVPDRLYVNTGSGASWLQVRLVGRASNRAAIGAKVTLLAVVDDQELLQSRDIQGGGGYAVQNEIPANFGLGDATNVMVLRVQWPSGLITELRDVAVNQFLTVEELPVGVPLVRVNGRFAPDNRYEFISHDPVSVSVETIFPNLFYTTDGSIPDFTSTPYTGVFDVSPPSLLRVVAYDADFAEFAEADPVELVFIESFPVLASSPGGGSIVLNPPNATFPSNSVVQIIATNAPGWSFLRWEGDLSGSNPTNALRVTGPASVQAIFGTPLNTTVTGGAANGAVALDPTNNPIAFGSTTRLMALPGSGKYLLRWNLAGSPITSLTNPILAFTVTNASPTLTALFGNLPTNHRSLTLRTEGAGSINRSPALAYYTNNSSVSLAAIPEPGWTFDGWAGDLSGTNNPQSVTFTANRTVSARFRFTGIIDPPVFASQPQDATRIIGQSVAFDAVVTGSAPLSFQWFFGTSPISGATLPSLNLGPLSLADSGTYLLVASNSAASVTSRVAQLTVNPPPNIPPTVTWLSPVGSEAFRVPTNIVLLARATDPDGSIQRVDFLLNGALLGSSTSASPSNTFTFTWTNPPAGTNTLSARAVDNQSASAVTEGIDLTVLQPLVTSFAWEFAATSEPERDGLLRLKVVKSGTAAGSVFYETVSSGAELRKDFLPIADVLTFAANETEKFVEIPLINEFMPDGPKTFEVRLSDPTPGTVIGLIQTTVVTLIDDDAALENNSFLGFFPSVLRTSVPGELQLFTEPSIAGGQWRLPWDARWRNSGDTITNLDPGPYITEFRPAAGFTSPAPATASVLANARTRATNVYVADPLQLPGTLRIDLSPLPALQADGLPNWRLVGDSAWLNSGQILSNLAPGPQVLEFRPVTGWAIPGNLSVLIQSGVDSSLGIEYSPAGDPPAGATPPASLPSYDSIRGGQQLSRKHPYPMSGQIRTPHGWASGVAVRDRVLLTAAHVLLDLGTNLVDPTSIEWFHERHTGTAGYQPRPIRAKGYYYNTNYLAARIAESQQPGWIPGSSTPASQEWDVAAIFFDEPIARVGQSGYLLSDAFPNVWLASTREKELIGYPITGINDGRLHTTRDDNYIFTQVPGTTRVFASSSFFSHAGNSGGPLCVLFDRAPSGSPPDPIYFPAAVYLGNYDGQSIVRSIDSMVASLINRAASSAKTGENFLDLGPYKGAPNFSTIARYGQIRVRLSPSSALALGAGWSFTNAAPFLPDNAVVTLPTGPVTLEFKPLTGFRTPAPRELSIVANVTNEITVTYQPFLPVFPPIADQSIPEGSVFSLPLTASHESAPAPALTFTLLDAPPGLTLTGNLLAWATTETNGPSSSTIRVAVSDGITSLTNRFTLSVTEVNQPPIPGIVPTQSLTNGIPWSFQLSAADPDLPLQPLVYSRLSGPVDLTLTPSGLVAWTPSESQAGSTNQVVWAVSDSVTSVTNTFTLLVAPRSIPATPAILSDVTLLGDGSLELSVTGTSGALYILESSHDLSLWTPITTNTAPFSFSFPTSHPSGASFLRAVSK